MKLILLVLILPLFSVCQQQVGVQFDFTFNNHVLERGTWYVTDSGDSLSFEKVQFFVSQTPEKGEDVNAKNVQLINWGKETSQLWATHLSKSNTLQFTFGLDSIYHVSSNMTGDLDPSLGMYWAWQSGYIQFKIEGKSPSSTARKNKFEYHLGGYMSPFAVSRKIDLGEVSAETVHVEVKLEYFFQNMRIAGKESVLIPGKEAIEQMNKAQKMFKLASHDD